jgi:hypothetical protein
LRRLVARGYGEQTRDAEVVIYSLMLIGIIPQTMVAGVHGVDGDATQLRVLSEVDAIVSVTKSCEASFSKSVSVASGSPNIQKKPILVSEVIWPDGDGGTAQSHCRFWRHCVVACSSKAHINFPDLPISVTF